MMKMRSLEVKEVIPFEMCNDLIEIKILLDEPIPYRIKGLLRATDELRVYLGDSNDVEDISIDIWDYEENVGGFLNVLDIEFVGSTNITELLVQCKRIMMREVMKQVRKLNIQGGF